MTDEPEIETPKETKATEFKNLRSNNVRQRTKKRTKRGRKPGSKIAKTIAKEKLAERALLPSNGRLAVEEMDIEIAKFEKLMEVLYPWDENGEKIETKSLQSYYWASEMRRDYLALRAPYQTPRLSAVAVVNPNQGQGQTRKITEVNVTILNERGDREYTDSPGDPNIVDAEIMPPEDEEAA